MTISKNLSTHCAYLLLHIYCIWNISLKEDCAFQNAHKDEYQNMDLPCGQLNDNVGISESILELEQVNMNLLEVTQYFRTNHFGIIWNMKANFHFIYDIYFVLIFLFLPKV
jgi:hypothetical protein